MRSASYVALSFVSLAFVAAAFADDRCTALLQNGAMDQLSETYDLAVAAGVVSLLATATEKPDCSTDEAIQHLLNFVAEAKNCSFVRNGKEWNPVAASEHMRNKYDRRKPGGKYAGDPEKAISTPAQFVDRGASRSSTTGEPYMVRCEGRIEETSSEWLTRELRRYVAACTAKAG